MPTKNVYSTTEAGYIASPCPMGHGLHVHCKNVIVEVLDSNNQPCQPGGTGRLVFTTLHNFLAPFVRYDILDDVTLAPGPCPCRRGLPLWTAGRGSAASDVLLCPMADGDRPWVSRFESDKRGGAHANFQIIQRADTTRHHWHHVRTTHGLPVTPND